MKVRKIVQVGLLPVRCSECNALLCQASTGSVISIVCGRCSTHTIVEASRDTQLRPTGSKPQFTHAEK